MPSLKIPETVISGGGIHQAAIPAVAGLHALRHAVSGLADNRENARLLASGLASLPGLRLDRDVIETNTFFAESEIASLTVQEFACALGRGALVNVPGAGVASFASSHASRSSATT